MAQGSIKITQISKDFNMKSKDVLDFFAKDLGIEKKSGATADIEEFELFMHKLTSSHQIKSIDAYLEGTTKITIKTEAKEPVHTPAPETKPAEAKPAAEVKKEAPVQKSAPEVKKETAVQKAAPNTAPVKEPVRQQNARPVQQNDARHPQERRQGFEQRQNQQNQRPQQKNG